MPNSESDAVSGVSLLRTIQTDSGEALTLAWSPDGGMLAAGGRGGIVRLWDAATGALRRALQWDTTWVRSLAWSPDGSTLASGSDDGTVRLWDAATGALLNTLEGHKRRVPSVAWSPDSGTLATGSDDGTVRLWDAATGALRHTLGSRGGKVLSVAWSPDGGTLASGSVHSTVRLWDAATGALRHTLKGHSAWVRSVAWSPDSGTLATGSDDGTVRLWDAATGALRHTLKSKEGVARPGRATRVAVRRTLGKFGEVVRSVSWSPNGGTLASGSDDGKVRLWDATSRNELATIESSGYRNPFNPMELFVTVAFHPKLSILACPSKSGDGISIWSVELDTRRAMASPSGVLERPAGVQSRPPSLVVPYASLIEWITRTESGELSDVVRDRLERMPAPPLPPLARDEDPTDLLIDLARQRRDVRTRLGAVGTQLVAEWGRARVERIRKEPEPLGEALYLCGMIGAKQAMEAVGAVAGRDELAAVALPGGEDIQNRSLRALSGLLMVAPEARDRYRPLFDRALDRPAHAAIAVATLAALYPDERDALVERVQAHKHPQLDLVIENLDAIVNQIQRSPDERRELVTV